MERIALVVPPGVDWTLPAYELALLLRHAANDHRARIAVLTAEARPLEALGPNASVAVGDLLRDRDVDLHPGTFPDHFDGRWLWIPWQGAVEVDAVVALPVPVGPAIPGLPHDRLGFVDVDGQGLVAGTSDVHAIGDVASHSMKQGGLAMQDADAVADAIARTLGGIDLAPHPAGPRVLRATLMDGEGELYLRCESSAGGWGPATVSREPQWWPAGKLAGGRLSHLLAGPHDALDVPTGGVR